jgi:ribonuclease P protein component
LTGFLVQRLATRAQFQAVLGGKIIARTPHFALHQLADGVNPLFPVTDVWIGAMVPKRWAKRAVTRNAIRRQVYTLSGERHQTFAPTAHLVRLRSAFNKTFFVSGSSAALKQAVRAELNELLEQLSNSALNKERA